MASRIYRTILRTTGTLQIDTGIVNVGGQSFQLSDCSRYSSLIALFDEYKLCAVKIRYVPRGNTHDIYNADIASGSLWECVDYDDANTSGWGLDTIAQYPNARMHAITSGFTRYWKPRFSVAMYAGISSTGYGSRRGFIDSAYPGIPHYGWKYVTQIGGTTGTSYYYDWSATYYLSFRNRR